MQILVMRHADALSRSKSDVKYDAERPLSEKGREQATAMGRLLASLAIAPDLIICSPFIRAQETAERVGAELKEKIEPLPLTELAPGSALDDLLCAAAQYGENGTRRMLAVLHQPDVSGILASVLSCSENQLPLRITPATLAGFTIDPTAYAGTASLDLYLAPTIFS